MKVAFGCDHAGYALKPVILDYLKNKQIDVLDMGTDSDESVDYPDFAFKVAKAVSDNEADYGVLICGTGLGMAISANKIAGIRAVTISEPFSAAMSRKHNNANVLTFGSRVIGPGMALKILEIFLSTEFEGGRHCVRLDKVDGYEVQY
jgi:ribose 5-phosphate isomerase B